jgi:hypothetical protein
MVGGIVFMGWAYSLIAALDVFKFFLDLLAPAILWLASLLVFEC